MYDVGRDDNVTFATAPFLEAPTLDLLVAEHRIDPDVLWNVVSQIADALQRAHDLGLVCRVLKPNNILVDSSGRAYLSEFGISSRRTGPMALTSPGYNLRSPQYLAPEQVEGREPTRRADVYAVGVLIFEILTETPLFTGRSAAEMLSATLNGQVPSANARNRRLPPGVDAALTRALAKDPNDRHESVWQLLEELIGVPDLEELPRQRTVRSVDVPTAPPLLPAAPDPVLERIGASLSGESDGQSGAWVEVNAPQLGFAPAPIPADSAVGMLHRIGVPMLECHDLPLLNSYFACLMRHAQDTAGRAWPQVLEAAGLSYFLSQDPPDDGERTATTEMC